MLEMRLPRSAVVDKPLCIPCQSSESMPPIQTQTNTNLKIMSQRESFIFI